jgi:hypothetical protein
MVTANYEVSDTSLRRARALLALERALAFGETRR